MSCVIHTDWEVTEAHAKVINDKWPTVVSVRRPTVLKNIPGVTGKRFTETIKSGIWIKPLGSVPVRTFSSVRDIARRSLVVFVSGTTTGQSSTETDYEMIRDMIRDSFHDRRGTGLCGEMYSRVSVSDYDIDDTARRRYDIDIMEVESIFREDR